MRHPVSFYGSSDRRTSGCVTRQTTARQHSRLVVDRRQLTLSSWKNGRQQCNELGLNVQQKNSSTLAQRHCRYINMQVRRLPRHERRACTTLAALSASNASEMRAVRRPNTATTRTVSLMAKSRVLISAELKDKADSKMKTIMSVSKSATDHSRTSGQSANNDVHRSDERRRDVVEKSGDEGVKLHNRRSLTECNATKQHTSVIGSARRPSTAAVHHSKVKVKYRSHSLSPARPLAVCRPRRSVNIKRSVCCCTELTQCSSLLN